MEGISLDDTAKPSSVVEQDSPAAVADPKLDAEEALIKRSLLVGQFESAVDCCIKAGRLADALLLATCGGAELWQKTQEKYFEMQKRPFMKVVKAIIKGELSTLVQESNLAEWKETLAILATYGKSEEFPKLCDALAARLEGEAKNLKDATLCYMCAVNVQKTINIWIKETNEKSERVGRSVALQELVEKVSVFRSSLQPPTQDLGKEMGEIFAEYALIMASQGDLNKSAWYASQGSNNTADTECGQLHHRLYEARGGPAVLAQYEQQPPFPFSYTEIGVAKPKAIPKEVQNPELLTNQNAAHAAQAPAAAFAQPAAQAWGADASGFNAAQQQQPQQQQGFAQQTQLQQPQQQFAQQGFAPQQQQQQQDQGFAPQQQQQWAQPQAQQTNQFQQAQTEFAYQQPAQPAQPAQPTQQVYQGANTGFSPAPQTAQPVAQQPVAQAAAPSAPATSAGFVPQTPAPMQAGFTPQPATAYASSPAPTMQAQAQVPTQAGFNPQAHAPATMGMPTQAQAQPQVQAQAPASMSALQKFQRDGFVTSVGNEGLQSKYGNSHYGKPAATAAAQPQPEAPKPKPIPQHVPAEHKPILDSFLALLGQLKSAGLNGGEKRQAAEVEKALKVLEYKLKVGSISASAIGKLQQISQQFNAGSFKATLPIHVSLTTSEWSEHKDWLKGLKYCIQLASKKYGR
jgi:protein transport protein SEC31